MKKRVLLTLFFLSSIAIIAAITSSKEEHDLALAKNFEVLTSVLKEVDLFYVDTVDVDKVVDNGLKSMLSMLDPYTTYMPESETEEFRTMTTGEYGGIGSVITSRDSMVMITEPYQGMPAQLGGLKPGDLLVSIDGKSTRLMPTAEASLLLKGEVNTPVRLTVRRQGVDSLLEVTLTRRKIQIPVVPYYGVVRDTLGYINLNSFTDKAATEVRNAVVALKQDPRVKAFVLDLRENPGGIIDEAIDIVNLFVPKGKLIVSTRGKVKQWDQEYKTTHEPLDTKTPLFVLVSNGSASAAEIVAGALQDLDRAVIVGERTFGKGLVQATRPIPYNGMVKVTTAKYYIPSGRCVQAINYAHRNADGSVGRVPDSLTNLFTTAAGRPVRDGGGVTPDIPINPTKVGNIAYYLAAKWLPFDFANQYAALHDSIGPMGEFVVSDSLYADFKRLVHTRKFSYDQQSLKYLKELREVATFEGYEQAAAAEFAALEAKLSHNLDKDLDHFAPTIKGMIALEVAKRYYYQPGEMKQALSKDKYIDEVLALMRQPQGYSHLLKKK